MIDKCVRHSNAFKVYQLYLVGSIIYIVVHRIRKILLYCAYSFHAEFQKELYIAQEIWKANIAVHEVIPRCRM